MTTFFAAKVRTRTRDKIFMFLFLLLNPNVTLVHCSQKAQEEKKNVRTRTRDNSFRFKFVFINPNGVLHCSNGFCSDAIRSNQTPNPSRRRSYRSRCSDVRAVKETDLKSVGQCPRRFKSCSERCYSFFFTRRVERTKARVRI